MARPTVFHPCCVILPSLLHLSDEPTTSNESICPNLSRAYLQNNCAITSQFTIYKVINNEVFQATATPHEQKHHHKQLSNSIRGNNKVVTQEGESLLFS